MAPLNVVVDLITPSSVNISWDPPPPEHTNGVILYNVIWLTDLQNELVQNTTSSSNWVFLPDLHPYYNYSLQIAAVTVSQGPFSDAQVFTTLEDGELLCSNVCLWLYFMYTLILLMQFRLLLQSWSWVISSLPHTSFSHGHLLPLKCKME